MPLNYSAPCSPAVFRRQLLFTLLECLTVFFLLSLLASLLLPALNVSMQSSRAIHCLGNLRQLGSSFMLYGEDNGGYFPLGIRKQTVLEHGGTNWARYMLPYYQDTRILDCPASSDPAPGSTPQALHAYDGNYGWNFDGTQGRYGPWETRISFPSRTYLLFDSGDPCITYWANKWANLMEELDLDWNSGNEGCNRHRGLVNIFFLDSHAGNRDLDAFLAAPNPSFQPPWNIQWSEPVLQPETIPFPER